MSLIHEFVSHRSHRSPLATRAVSVAGEYSASGREGYRVRAWVQAPPRLPG